MKQLQFFKPISSIQTAKHELDLLIKHPLTLKVIKWNLLLIGLIWVIFSVTYYFLPPEIPLFYSLPWGQEQLVIKNYLFILPISCTVLSLINIRLASIFLTKETLLALITLWLQIICSLLIIISLIKTSFLLI